MVPITAFGVGVIVFMNPLQADKSATKYPNKPTPEKSKSIESSAADHKYLTVNPTIWSGNWDIIKGEIKKKWANLTDDDLLALEGDSQLLKGKIERRYGLKEQEAKKQVENFYRQLALSIPTYKKDVRLFWTSNPNIWGSRWHKIKGSLKKTWGKLTDDDLKVLEGRQEHLNSVLQKRYGIDQERDKAKQERLRKQKEAEIDEFYNHLTNELYTKPKK